MDLKKALPILDKFVAWVSLKKILLLSFAALAYIVTLTFFEHRAVMTEIFKSQDMAPIEIKLEIIDETKKHIEEVVQRSGDVTMISVVSANLRVNQREIVFMYSDNPVLELKLKTHMSTRGKTQPI